MKSLPVVTGFGVVGLVGLFFLLNVSLNLFAGPVVPRAPKIVTPVAALTDWDSDLSGTLETAAKTGKPIIALIQGQPDSDAARKALRHPLVAEVASSHFQPVQIVELQQWEKLIRANSSDKEATGAIRFLNSDGQPIVGKSVKEFSAGSVAAQMSAALSASGQQVPEYLTTVADGERLKQMETAIFGMYCYWEGESRIGGVDGVYQTRAGWRSGLEVVSVVFDPQEVEYESLLKLAREFRCASQVFTTNEKQYRVASKLVPGKVVAASSNQRDRLASTSDQKHYLQNSIADHLPLTEIQSTKVNAAIRVRGDYAKWLSPNQLKMLQQIAVVKKSNPSALSGLSYRDGVDDMASYQAKLVAALDRAQ